MLRLLGAMIALAALLAVPGCGDGSRPAASRILFLSDRDGDWALYSMDASGHGQRRVLGAGSADPFGSGVGYGEPVLSPDGRNVLLVRNGVTLASLRTGVVRRISAGEAGGAGWSPDSRRFAFSGVQNDGLFVADLAGRKRTLLSSTTTWMPTWSPDGKWIAFARQIGYGPTEVYAVHPDGTGLRRVAGYSPSNLAWSRDGRLAFVGLHESQEVGRLVVVDEHGWRLRVLPWRLADGTVEWAPDGRRLAYASSGNGAPAAIAVLDADGSGRRRLTPARSTSSDESPTWSADGKSLLFVRTPLGGDAEREVPEIWTMLADGSHRRPLTKPYPDGAENIEPAWAAGPTRTEAAPQPKQAREAAATVLRVPFPVDGIAAEGDRAAIAPASFEMQRETRPTPPVLLWRPGHGRPSRLVAAPCGGVRQLTLVGTRLAFDCNQVAFDLYYQSLWVYDLRTRLPRVVFFGHSGPEGHDVSLDSVVGQGDLLAFGSASYAARGSRGRYAVWRVDGVDSIAVRARPGTGDLVAAGGGLLATQLRDRRIALLRTDGRVVRVIAPSRGRATETLDGFEPKPPFLLVGRQLMLLEAGRLGAYDVRSGKLIWTRRVPRGARLEGADGRLVVYSTGSSISLVSRGGDRVLRTGARQLRSLRDYVDGVLHAALTPQGLWYCFNVADRRYPGRVVFVPRAALPR